MQQLSSCDTVAQGAGPVKPSEISDALQALRGLVLSDRLERAGQPAGPPDSQQEAGGVWHAWQPV